MKNMPDYTLFKGNFFGIKSKFLQIGAQAIDFEVYSGLFAESWILIAD